MCVCVCRAFVLVDNKLYKMHVAYIKTIKLCIKTHQNPESDQINSEHTNLHSTKM
jgi:hypothetical protein